MKKALLIPFLLCSNILFCQDTIDYTKIKLIEPSDYKFAESSVLYAANFVLSRSFSSKDSQSLRASQFIFDWISRTPDYKFPFDSANEITKGDNDLFLIYLACLAKFRIEHEDDSLDLNTTKLNSAKMLIEYCSNPKYKVKLTKHIKKLIEANKEGRLEKALE